MSILSRTSTLKSWTEQGGFQPLFKGMERCFYCGERLDDLSIGWNGWLPDSMDGVYIALHPGCVAELTIRLLRDVHEWECLGNRVSTSGTGTE